ncbi:efflux RND transporter periplasmic adaptor subunit [Daejeonella lutea]|uniref:RND family efflux transporter, MFP subunit n=1 Tax=Daejeonella lutea TaxID=572036 RepID=A0A1T5AEL2_9SPHI|nr:efflux RND transporter periplasmic adaptor subunit [Daejeonella lutea]SKB33103.1 RND family efflux transporter, MFP subunit [Daejeonella lutea]
MIITYNNKSGKNPLGTDFKNLKIKTNNSSMKNLIFMGIVLFLAACGGKTTDKKTELETLKKQRVEINSKIAALEAEVGSAKTAEDVKTVGILEVQESTFSNFLEVQGRIDAEDNVQVSPEAQGVVTAVYASVGQNVGRGQVLAQIDDKVLRQNISELQTQLSLATTLYQRQKNLWDQKIGTEVQFINARTQKEAAERRISTLRSQIAMYKIKAPISGTIDAMDMKVGSVASPGMSSIRIINANKLKAKAQVAESYAGRVNQGDNVQVILPDVPDSINTKISFASKTIDPVSRSFNVEIKLPANSRYRPNMLSILKIIDYKNDKALIVPVNAIQKAENGDYLFISDNGKAKRVNIQTGKISEGKAEILSGLKVGDKVVIAGTDGLSEGDVIKAN